VSVHITRFNTLTRFVDIKTGKLTPEGVTALNLFAKQAEDAINAQPAIEAATVAANTAAAAANTAVEQIQDGTIEITAIQVPGGTRVAWDGTAFTALP
jgi:hypothetical protein